MNASTIAWYTVLLLVGTNLIGLLYSMLVLYTDLFRKFTIQKKQYVKGVFTKRMPLYLFNITLLLAISGLGAYFGLLGYKGYLSESIQLDLFQRQMLN